MDRLENPNLPPIVVYKDKAPPNSRFNNLKRGLSAEDQTLVDRLERLKKETGAVITPAPSQGEIEERLHKLRAREIPSQEEIEERLASLKGIDVQVLRKPHTFVQQVRQPNVDSATALINQMVEEVAIDQQTDAAAILSCGSVDEAHNQHEGGDEAEKLLLQETTNIQLQARQALQSLQADKEIQQRY